MGRVWEEWKRCSQKLRSDKEAVVGVTKPRRHGKGHETHRAHLGRLRRAQGHGVLQVVCLKGTMESSCEDYEVRERKWLVAKVSGEAVFIGWMGESGLGTWPSGGSSTSVT